MLTKRTILSEKELNLIENLISKHGSIVTFSTIYNELKRKISRQSVRNLTNKLTKNGWLVRIKKGVYFIAGIESRGFANISIYKTPQVLISDSYVSMEAALQYHKMFDQFLKTVTSISLRSYKTKNIESINYKFVKTKRELYYGFETKRVENEIVKIATTEKAILDLLHFKRNIYTIDLVLEKLLAHKKDLNHAFFKKHCKRQSVTDIRLLGFLFDKAGINSDYLLHLTKSKKNCSFMTKGSKIFNAKWRLYYEKHLKQVNYDL